MLLQPLHNPDHKPIYARSGWEIPQSNPTEVPQTDLEINRIRAKERQSWRGGLIVRSISTYPYNCVGMIFAARRAWIEIDHIYDILREDGYQHIRREQAVVGDVVLYKTGNEPVHVALITDIQRVGIQISIRVLSKWGAEAEFEHFVENVPSVFGQPAEFFTERVAL